MKLYNTLTRKIEQFVPIKTKYLTMYVCGPTVYNHIHIGNARPVIFFDVLRNYFEYLDYDVNYVSNITDIDDKIINEAKEKGVSELELTQLFTKEFVKATKFVGSNLPTQMPLATDYIENMIAYIESLIAKGYAYNTKSGVYFKINALDNYGLLSNQNKDELAQSVRIENQGDKEDARDFSLWKNTDDGLNYESPFGTGRPGWHTECAVMNLEIFKDKIDIHGGGSDLIFPHHENEIAQTIAHDNHHLANYWLHVGRLDFDNEKMSKSIGNTVLVKDLKDPLAFRMLTLAHHYRSPINFSFELMDEYVGLYDRLVRTLKRTKLKLYEQKNENIIDEQIMSSFESMMNEDLNTAKVISLILETVKTLNNINNNDELLPKYNSLNIILNILGLKPNIILSSDIIDTYQSWQQARLNKNYQLADKLRIILLEEGWI